MATGRRLHTLRTGDGPGIPADEPPELWPDFGDLEPYWDSFVNFALSEFDDDVRFSFEMQNNGEWEFRASTRIDQQPTERTGESYTQSLVYDPTEDKLTFTDNRDGSSWVMEDAFNDPLDASSRL